MLYFLATTTHAATTPLTIATTLTPQPVQSCVDDSRINCDQSVCNTDLRMFCRATCRVCSKSFTCDCRTPLNRQTYKLQINFS